MDKAFTENEINFIIKALENYKFALGNNMSIVKTFREKDAQIAIKQCMEDIALCNDLISSLKN